MHVDARDGLRIESRTAGPGFLGSFLVQMHQAELLEPEDTAGVGVHAVIVEQQLDEQDLVLVVDDIEHVIDRIVRLTPAEQVIEVA